MSKTPMTKLRKLVNDWVCSMNDWAATFDPYEMEGIMNDVEQEKKVLLAALDELAEYRRANPVPKSRYAIDVATTKKLAQHVEEFRDVIIQRMEDLEKSGEDSDG